MLRRSSPRSDCKVPGRGNAASNKEGEALPTKLPAALPLFMGGTGLIGLLGRRSEAKTVDGLTKICDWRKPPMGSGLFYIDISANNPHSAVPPSRTSQSEGLSANNRPSFITNDRMTVL
jgi:hypothetical protein